MSAAAVDDALLHRVDEIQRTSDLLTRYATHRALVTDLRTMTVSSGAIPASVESALTDDGLEFVRTEEGQRSLKYFLGAFKATLNLLDLFDKQLTDSAIVVAEADLTNAVQAIERVSRSVVDRLNAKVAA